MKKEQEAARVIRDAGFAYEQDPVETQWRRELLRGYLHRGLLYVQCQFDPFGTPFCPAINGTPAGVAEWLRQLAADIEGMEEGSGD